MEIEHVAFADLLATHNGDRVVDLLILDAEGAEFGITPILLGMTGELEPPPQSSQRVGIKPYFDN